MFRTYSYILKNKLQFLDQVTPKNFLWSIKKPCKSEDFDQQISLDADGDDTNRLTPYPIKARNPVKTFTPNEVENCFIHAVFTAQRLGIYRQPTRLDMNTA